MCLFLFLLVVLTEGTEKIRSKIKKNATVVLPNHVNTNYGTDICKPYSLNSRFREEATAQDQYRGKELGSINMKINISETKRNL